MIHYQKVKPILKSLLVFIFLVSVCTKGFSQDIILYDQGDVDAFFPGTIYNGNITIGKSVGGGSPIEITNLFNLSVLKVLNGNLVIRENAALEDLDDLSNLEAIYGQFELIDNAEIQNLDGFSNLTVVEGGFSISSNHKLSSLSGLENMTTIGALAISNNNSLLEIKNFSNLTEIVNLSIISNINLVKINGFNSLDSLNIIEIRLNNSLEEIIGFSNLDAIINGFYIWENNILANLNGFNKITSLGRLHVSNNEMLSNLDIFENLISITNSLSIFENNNLTNCCGVQDILSDPTAIGGPIYVADNPSECSSQEEVVSNYCGLEFNVYSNPSCIDESNGSLQIDVNRFDTIPFFYSWERLEDGVIGMGTSLTNYFNIDMLAAGTYDITVMTPKPDTAYRFNIEVLELNGSNFEIIQVESTNSTNGALNGSIEIIVSGSLPPYSVSWSGASIGSNSGILTDTITIPFISAGEYNVIIEDSKSQIREITLTLLDETVPVFPCTEPLDIVILNDVSGSVDSVEYQESKDFFVHFLEVANIGLNMDESRAAIIEWSGVGEHEIKIPITGDFDILNAYKTAQKSYDGDTQIHGAMNFGGEYLDGVVRPGVAKVMILATDGLQGQVPGSLIALADQFKAKGYHILTIAFDDAFSNIVTRDILYKMASIGALAPGAPAYSDLDENLAENIVNTYLCPLDPGESANVYFSRDGSIDIIDLTPIANCLNPQ